MEISYIPRKPCMTELVLLAAFALAGCKGDDGSSADRPSIQVAATQSAAGKKPSKPAPSAPSQKSLEASMSAGGRVSSADGLLDCIDICAVGYTSGQSVTLTATPAVGYVFRGWGGGCTGTTTQCTVAMSAARQVYASFRPVAAPRPGASTTGVPAGTTLTASGSITIDKAGTVIDGRDVRGCITVAARNVVIRRTRVRCDSWYPVRIHDNASLLIEDSEIAGEGPDATSSIAFENYTARRVNMHGASDGAKVGVNVVLEDNWIHDLWLAPGDHGDGIQTTGSDNVVIRNNYVDIADRGSSHGEDPNSVIQAGIENNPNSRWLIEGNWFIGGNWTVHWDSGRGTGNIMRNNRFGRGTDVKGRRYPLYGPIAWLGQGTFSGNVWDDTGDPISGFYAATSNPAKR